MPACGISVWDNGWSYCGRVLDGLLQGWDRSFGISSVFFVKEQGLTRWSCESLLDLRGGGIHYHSL